MEISAANAPTTPAIQPAPLRPEALTAQPAAQDAPNSTRSDNNGIRENGETGKKQNQPQELSEEEQQQVKALQSRDREVRAHEAAHLAAAGGLARGGASFSYQTGPDGRAYAVGGEVSIDTSPVDGDPQATIQKAQTIRAAALAPAQPSGADQGVAAAASKLEASARVELALQKAEEQQAAIEDSAADDKTTQGIEESTEKLSPAELSTRNAESEANRYQDTINGNAPSDVVGQLLNTSA